METNNKIKLLQDWNTPKTPTVRNMKKYNWRHPPHKRAESTRAGHSRKQGDSDLETEERWEQNEGQEGEDNFVPLWGRHNGAGSDRTL